MASIKTLNETYGVILYDIELNGCLNGVYIGPNSEIYNEILRKKSDAKLIGSDIYDVYDCQFIDCDDLHNCEVRAKPHKAGYIFEWHKSNASITPFFRGVGYKMNARQIAMYYV